MTKLKFNNFRECIDFYDRYRKNEYVIRNNIVSPHNHLLHHQEGMGTLVLSEKNDGTGTVTVTQDAVDRFHPNKIDNKEFWTYAKQKFPKFSVCGSPSRTIKHCNEKTLEMPKTSGYLEIIDNFIQQNPDTKLDFFEIGYGHGNIFDLYNDKLNYKGIDFYKIAKLKKHKNLMIIDKSGIPDFIEECSQDIVYGMNVFQHCSQQDRFQYYEQAYEKLKHGGFFFGSCFIWSPEIADLPVWGVKDEHGRYYCHFFNQLTEVDTYQEFRKKMKSIGFFYVDSQLRGNHFTFILQKS